MLALAVAAALAVAGTPVTETVGRGELRAAVRYVTTGPPPLRSARVTIQRRGRVVLSQRVQAAVEPGTVGVEKSIAIRDLDDDGDDEIVLYAFTGGNHCCFVLYAWTAVGATFRRARLTPGGLSYRERDLDADGRPEWIGEDDDFKLVFTSWADSYAPVRIFAYRRMRFVVVTRRFPSAVRAHARDAWRMYQRERRRVDVRGILAAWAADEYLLREADDVWPALDRVRRRGDVDARYIRELRRELRRLGYAR